MVPMGKISDYKEKIKLLKQGTELMQESHANISQNPMDFNLIMDHISISSTTLDILVGSYIDLVEDLIEHSNDNNGCQK